MRDLAIAILLIVLSGVIASIYNSYLPLHGDEAYYWLWSHHLQTGYYDHPPMIAFMIYLSNFISETEWGVRLINVASMSVAALVIYRITQKMSDSKSALTSVIIFLSVLLVHAGYTITTTDSPLILFYSLALLAFYNVLTRAKVIDFILLGVWLGLMMLSKYTAILFVVSLLLFVLLRRRDLLSEWRSYLSASIAFVIILPMLWWNYEHNWISFAFQASHGGEGEFALNYAGEFIGSQFLIFTPIFAWVLFASMFKHRLYYRDDRLFMLSIFTLTPLLFFLYKSFFIHIELNYSAPAYIGAAIIVALALRDRKKTLVAGVVLALVLSVVARVALLFYLPQVQDRMYGNKEAVQMLQTHRIDSDAIYADHLTLASLITYYSPDRPEVRIPTSTRFSQYDMWDSGSKFKAGLYLSDGDDLEELEELFERVELIDKISFVLKDNKSKSYYLYRVY